MTDIKFCSWCGGQLPAVVTGWIYISPSGVTSAFCGQSCYNRFMAAIPGGDLDLQYQSYLEAVEMSGGFREQPKPQIIEREIVRVVEVEKIVRVSDPSQADQQAHNVQIGEAFCDYWQKRGGFPMVLIAATAAAAILLSKKE